MLARTTTTQLSSDSDAAEAARSAADHAVVVEASDIELAEKVSELLSEFDLVEVTVTNGSGGSVRMIGSSTSKGSGGPTAARRVALRSMPSGQALADAVRQGVWAIVDPSSEDFDSQLIDSVKRTIAGRCPALELAAFDEKASSAIMATITARAQKQRSVSENPLSKTEVEILARIARGQTSRDIAGDLGFHIQTVKNRVTIILNKTNANSRSHAAAIAQSNGWIEAPANGG